MNSRFQNLSRAIVSISCLLVISTSIVACAEGEITLRGKGNANGASIGGGLSVTWGEQKDVNEAPAGSKLKGTIRAGGKPIQVVVAPDGTIWVHFPGGWVTLDDGCITVRTPEGKMEQLCAGGTNIIPGGGSIQVHMAGPTALSALSVGAVALPNVDGGVIDIGSGSAQLSDDLDFVTASFTIAPQVYVFNPLNPDNGMTPLNVTFFASEQLDGSQIVFIEGPLNDIAKYCVGQYIDTIQIHGMPIVDHIKIDARMAVTLLYGADGQLVPDQFVPVRPITGQ